MTTINAQRQLQSTLRGGNAPAYSLAKKHVNHIKQLHEAAVKRSDALSKSGGKVTGGLTNKKEMTSDELVEYRLRDSSEEDARQIAFQAHQQMDFLLDVKSRVDASMKASAVLFQEEEIDPDADPEENLKGREWVENSRRKINGQIFRYNESCDEREEQLSDFCNWFELYENIWPLPLVTNNIQYDELQGSRSEDRMNDELEDQINEMEKMWPKMGMMREDLSNIMGRAAEMGRRALSAELKAEVENLTRKLNTSEELAEFLQKSLDTERNTIRELRNEVSKNKQVNEAQMARKNEEIKGLNEQISQAAEANKKQMDEIRAMYVERENKLKDSIKKMQEEHKAQTDSLRTQVADLTAINFTLEEKVKELKTELEEKEEHITRLRETVRDLEERLEIKTKELAKAIEDLRIEKEEAKKREAKYVKMIEEQKRIIKKKEEELREKDIIIAEKQAKIEALQQEIGELKMQIKKLERELEETKKKLEDANAKIAELEKRVASLKAACEKLKKEVDVLKKRVEKLEQDAAKYVAQIAGLHENIATLEKELAATKEELAQAIAAHEADKVKWAAEKKAFEKKVSELEEDLTIVQFNLKKKEEEYDQLAEAKQKMMEEYEKTIADERESYEARISTLETEVSDLQEFKTAIESRTFADAETEVENGWFVENANAVKKSKKDSTTSAPNTAGSEGGNDGGGEGGMNSEQTQRMLSKFKTLREKLYFMRVGFERDSTEFRSGIKETLESKAAMQKELDLDVTLLRQKLDQMVEVAEAERVSISETDSAGPNRMILDLCDESICLIEHLGTSRGEVPSRLACEMVLDMNPEESVGNEDTLKGMIAADVARACGGSFDKVKVRSLRGGPVIADLILCKGLHPDGRNTMEIFKLLSNQANDPDSVLRHGEVTARAVEVRLKKCYAKQEPKKSSNLKLLQGVPLVMLDLEQVLDGIEGALVDPVTLSNDPTMYSPNQERPSSAVVAQLRPLLSVAKGRFGADLSEGPFDFSNISKLHNKWRKSDHVAQDSIFDAGPRTAPASNLSQAARQQSPPASPLSGARRKASWKVEVPSPAPSPLPMPERVAGNSKREVNHQQSMSMLQRTPTFQSNQSRQQPGPAQSSEEQRSREFMQRRYDVLQQQNSFKKAQNAYGASTSNIYNMSSDDANSRSSKNVTRAANGSKQSLVTFGANDYFLDPEAVDQNQPGSTSEFDPMRAKRAMRQAASYNRQHEQFQSDHQQIAGSASCESLGLFVKQMGSPMRALAGPYVASAQGMDMAETFPPNKAPLNQGRASVGEGSYAQTANYVQAGTYAMHQQASEVGVGMLEGVTVGQSWRQQKSATASGGPSAGQSSGQGRTLSAGPEEAPLADNQRQDVQWTESDDMPRFRTANKTNISEPPYLKASSKPKTAAERPVTKPLTMSRRYSPAELNALSVENLPDGMHLPRLMETYEMQRVGIVGKASFHNRPATLDGGVPPDLEFMRKEIEAEIAASEPKYGLLPAFSDRDISVGGGRVGGFRDANIMPMGGTGNFASRPLVGAVKVKPAKIQNRSGSPRCKDFNHGGSVRNPPDMAPWGSAKGLMERSFDTSASAPAYRPSKVIRSVDNSMSRSRSLKDKPRANTINPRLNSMELEIKIDQRSDYDLGYHGIDVVEHVDPYGEFSEQEFDPLLQFEEPANQV